MGKVMMKRSCLVIFLGLLFFAGRPFVSPAYADKIFLKSGKNYEGKLVGRSERRYLFALDSASDSPVKISFFLEDVDKIELSKDTVESQIPYLKDVESLKVDTQPKSYEISIYKEGQGQKTEPTFTEKEVAKALGKEEGEYYQRFNDILKKYVDKFQFIQNIYLNLTTASKEDFASAKIYMDELYFELNNIFVPEAFKKSHVAYLQSVKASFLAFSALEQGMLDEAAKQIKVSEESKQHSMDEFRSVCLSRQAAVQAAKKEAGPQPAQEGTPQEPNAKPTTQ